MATPTGFTPDGFTPDAPAGFVPDGFVPDNKPSYNVDLSSKKALAANQLAMLERSPDFQALPEAEKARLRSESRLSFLASLKDSVTPKGAITVDRVARAIQSASPILERYDVAGKILGTSPPPQEQTIPYQRYSKGQGILPNAEEAITNIPSSAARLASGLATMPTALSKASLSDLGNMGKGVLTNIGDTLGFNGGDAAADRWVGAPVEAAGDVAMAATAAKGLKNLKGNVAKLNDMRPAVDPEIANLGKTWDVPLTAGMESNIGGLKNLEAQLERVPVVGTRPAMAKGSSSVAAAANRLVAKFTPENPVDIPDQIQENMLKTLQSGKDKVKGAEAKLQNAVIAANPDPIVPTALQAESQKLLADSPDIFDRLPSTPIKSKLEAIANGTSPKVVESMTANDQILGADGQPILQGTTSTVPPAMTFNEAIKFRSMLGNYIDRAYKSAGAVGSKETYQLTSLKRALDTDINNWGESLPENSNIQQLFKDRNKAYIDGVVPFKDFIVKKATGNAFDTDLLINSFVKGDRPQLAGKLMNSLTPEGQQLVKYSVLKKALDAGLASKEGVPFSPAKFATEIEKLGSSFDAIFPKAEGTMIKGFAKLARVAERYGQYDANPINGVKVHDTGITVGVGYGIAANPLLTGGALGMTKLLSTLLTTSRGKSLLLRAAKTPESSPRLQSIMTELSQP